MNTVQLTKREFNFKVSELNDKEHWAYLGERPCVIDFYTSWCTPCKKIAPLLEDIAIEYANYVDVYKINADEEPELAAAFGVKCLPTLVFCPMIENPHIIEGTLSMTELVDQVESLLIKEELYAG